MRHKLMVFIFSGITLFSLGFFDNPWSYIIAIFSGILFYIGIELTARHEGSEAIDNDKSRYMLIGVIAVSFMVVPWFDWSGTMAAALAIISLAFSSFALWAVSPSRDFIPSA